MAKDDKIRLLRDVPLFWGLSDKELKAVAKIVDETSMPAGATLMKEGAVGHEMMIIASGSVVIERGGRMLGRAGQSEVVGELALLHQGPRIATVTAETDVKLYVVAASDFTELLLKVPQVAVRILTNVGARLREVETKALD